MLVGSRYECPAAEAPAAKGKLSSTANKHFPACRTRSSDDWIRAVLHQTADCIGGLSCSRRDSPLGDGDSAAISV